MVQNPGFKRGAAGSGFEGELSGVNLANGRGLGGRIERGPVHDEIALDDRPLIAIGVDELCGAIEGAFLRLAILVGLESDMAELQLAQFPTISGIAQYPGLPLGLAEEWSGRVGEVQCDAVWQRMRSRPLIQQNAADVKVGQDGEFVRGAVHGVPEVFEDLALELGEELGSPEGFIEMPFLGFQGGELGEEFLIKSVGGVGGVGGSGGCIP